MASQNTLLIFLPYNNEPPSSNYATLGIRNNHPVLDFDSGTNESAIFTGILPKQYSGNGITVYIHYTMDSATSGNIYWNVSFERIGDQVLDIDSDNFASAQSANETVPGTAGYVSIISIPFTDGAQIDAIAAGEAFRLKITRDAATDTATGDARLIGIEIRET